MKNTSVYISTIALLGLFAGGSITILFIIVPFWHSLTPNELMLWFNHYGARVGITMLPMQIIPFILSIYAYISVRKRNEDGKGLWLWVNVSNIIILIMLLAYFLPINFQFVNQTMNPNEVPSELIRWEIIHIARTILTVLSAILAIIAYFKLVRNSIYINMKPSNIL
ncbi:DUF1772 domain-containing protein [Flavobacterium dauae]|uniref:DUF1772 domain-containing protein n=1 Tax=Flavobacterium dauae TaxID=1563479 RepID=UPI00101B3273|nr:DUF1772 domain-containing protein [Flavobacterium dauae]WLD23531.1 DUF1772 domain-containing protein [Flavobacterium dauae]